MTDWNLIDRCIHYDVVIPHSWLIFFGGDISNLLNELRLQLVEITFDGIGMTDMPMLRINNQRAMLQLRHDIEVWWFRLFNVNSITDRCYYILENYGVNLFLNMSDYDQEYNFNIQSTPPAPSPPSLPTPSAMSSQVATVSRYYSWAQEPMGMRRLIGQWMLQSSIEMIQQQQQEYEEEEQQRGQRRRRRRRRRRERQDRRSSSSERDDQRR
ncbi:GSCOCG00011744001-RA-CDS, partial [Cotesia congregata]